MPRAGGPMVAKRLARLAAFFVATLVFYAACGGRSSTDYDFSATPTAGAAGLAGSTSTGTSTGSGGGTGTDRKSTRLNSSHVEISYAVFCLKKKKTQN